MTRILVVDDEERIRKLLKMFLEKEGFEVQEAEHGEEALAWLAGQSYDLVIMDIMMPVMDGITAIKEIRAKWAVPVIMLTAKGEEADRVLGFEQGADDYVVKPFSTRELVLRVKAILKRHQQSTSVEASPKFTFPKLTIKPESREVISDGTPVVLTPLEFDLLLHMAQHPGRVYTREQLLEQVWGYDYFGDLRTVDTHIKRLREKLAKAGDVSEYVATVWGVGYKFEVI